MSTGPLIDPREMIDAAVAAERERCAHACREWQAGRLPHGIGTHDLLRAIEGPNDRIQPGAVAPRLE